MALTKEETPFEKWFQMTFSLEKQSSYLREYAWYQERGGNKKFPEFIKYMMACRKKPFPNFEDRTFLTTLESSYRNYITSKGKLLRGVHPPLTDLSYKIAENQEVECSPFSRTDKQGNFANLSLYTIGQQLNRVETQIQDFKSRDYRPEKGESSKPMIEKKVLFKPMEIEKLDLKLADHSEMITEITKMLAELGLDSKKKSVAPLTKDLTFEEEIEKRLKQLSIAPISDNLEFFKLYLKRNKIDNLILTVIINLTL